MRVLVTGGAGFIGSHIVEHFQGKADVRILDNLRTGYRHNLDGFEAEFVEGSIMDRQILAKAMAGVDYVFHLAAMISVPESMEKPVEMRGDQHGRHAERAPRRRRRRCQEALPEHVRRHLRGQPRGAQARDHAARAPRAPMR